MHLYTKLILKVGFSHIHTACACMYFWLNDLIKCFVSTLFCRVVWFKCSFCLKDGISVTSKAEISRRTHTARDSNHYSKWSVKQQKHVILVSSNKVTLELFSRMALTISKSIFFNQGRHQRQDVITRWLRATRPSTRRVTSFSVKLHTLKC